MSYPLFDAYGNLSNEWKHQHEVCNEFMSQLVEHLYKNGEDSVRVLLNDLDQILLPFVPQIRR